MDCCSIILIIGYFFIVNYLQFWGTNRVKKDIFRLFTFLISVYMSQKLHVIIPMPIILIHAQYTSMLLVKMYLFVSMLHNNLFNSYRYLHKLPLYILWPIVKESTAIHVYTLPISTWNSGNHLFPYPYVDSTAVLDTTTYLIHATTSLLRRKSRLHIYGL